MQRLKQKDYLTEKKQKVILLHNNAKPHVSISAQ